MDNEPFGYIDIGGGTVRVFRRYVYSGGDPQLSESEIFAARAKDAEDKLEQSIDIYHLTPDQQQRVRLFVKGLESDT